MSTADLLSAAIAHHKAGRLDQAAAIIDTILADTPDQPDALHVAGVLALQRGDKDGCIALLRRAIVAAPERAVLHNDLGAALRLSGRLQDAADAFEEALRRNPEAAETWHNLGLTRRALGDFTGAATALRRAVTLAPGFAPAHNALGIVLDALGDAPAARAAFGRAVELAPDYAEALSNLGLALHLAGQAEQAFAALNRAVALKPGLADAQFNLGVVRQAAGDFAGATEAWRKTVALDPTNQAAHSNLLMALHYDPAQSGATLLAEARRWGARHARAAAQAAPWANRRDPDRRLRIGYVSPDFRDHSCAHFLRPLFAAHDRKAVELFAYAELRRRDSVTDDFRTRVAHWRETAGRTAQAVADQIRADAIDILVDLAGHSASNRLDVFALKPAPIQVSWLGYPGTTGLPAIDYRLTDADADPPGAEAHASETLIRLPRGFHCWAPPADAATVAVPPTRPVTFGSFNNVQKVNPAVVAVWSELLQAVSGSRLVLKSSWLSRPRTVDALRGAFARHGIGADRLVLSGWIEASAAHLAAYADVDIALDPFPYNGTTTTLEALWMGVPVIALAGERHSGRVGVSLLRQVGMPELIAGTPADYVKTATALAHDHARLATYRTGLRQRLAASPLMDAASFARDLEAAYRTMWRRWCGSDG